MSAPGEEAVPASKLIGRRRYLGYFIFIVNIPTLTLTAYEVALKLSNWAGWNSPDFFSDLILLALSFGLAFVLPRWLPVFASTYRLTGTGVKISRFLKGAVTVPYPSIARADVYVQDKRSGKVSKEALQYAKESADKLRKSGFKFSDYTNDETNIVLLISGKGIFLLSPMYPKAFIQKLRKRAGTFPATMVELSHSGKRTREI